MESELPNEWKNVLLEDYLETILDYRGKTPKKSDKGILTLSAKSVKMGYVDYERAYYISEKTYEKFMVRGFPKKGDVLVTTEAPLGCIAKLDNASFGIAQRLITIRGKDGILDNSYLLYYLQSPYGQHELQSRATGTTVVGIRRSEFKKVSLLLPPFVQQQKIATILSSLDDKIELNNKMNQTLEKMAQTLFKEWFEEFKFPDAEGKPYKTNDGLMHPSELGDIPEGWEVLRIKDISKNKAKTHKFKKDEEVVFINTGDILKGQFLHENISIVGALPGQAKKIIEKHDILYSEIRPKNKRFLYVFDDMPKHIVSTKFMVIKANEKIISRYLYMILTDERVIQEINTIAESRSGTFPQITFDSIGLMLFVIPPLKYQKIFCEQLDSFDEMIKQNQQQTQTLTKLRDTLLPKLMRGEIKV